MSAFVLVSGTLQKPAEVKQSKAGRAYIVASLIVADGASENEDSASLPKYWKLLGFDDEVNATLRDLNKGDALAARGRLQLEVWTPDDDSPRIVPTVLVARIRPMKRKSAKKGTEAEAESRSVATAQRIVDIDDDIPF
jgi:single-stranded DNA-binding protein